MRQAGALVRDFNKSDFLPRMSFKEKVVHTVPGGETDTFWKEQKIYQLLRLKLKVDSL